MKKILIGIIVIVLIAAAAFFVYDRIILAPSITISFKENPGQQKMDAAFKVKIEVTSLSHLKRKYYITLDLTSEDSKNIPLPTQDLELEPGKKTVIEFNCIISEPFVPGNYSATAAVSAQKSLLSASLSKVAEEKAVFLVSEKIINGIVNIIKITPVTKVGETIKISVVVKNTGELEKPFHVKTFITDTKAEKTELPVEDISLKIEESKKITQEHNIPLSSTAGKFMVFVELWAGESNDTGKKKVSEVSQEISVQNRIVKLAIESVKSRGKFKSGESIGFDAEFKNTGDIAKIFSIDANLISPSGKAINMPQKEFTLDVNASKKVQYEYNIPVENSDGKYKISITAYVGSINDISRNKKAEYQQDFTVAERITKASISDIKISGKTKVGGSLSILVDVKNTGETVHSFPVNVSINNGISIIKLPIKEVQLQDNEAKSVSFDYEIPLEDPYGTYEIRASVWNEKDQTDKLTELFEEKISNVKIGGPIISGSALISGTLGDKFYGDTAAIKVNYSNTGEAKHTYFMKLEVYDPADKISTLINEKIELDKGESKEKSADYRLDVTMSDGKYKAAVSIWEKLGDDGNPVNKYGEDTQSFTLIDKKPEIVNLVAVPPEKGKEGSINVKVKDDREVSSVKLVYQGPGMMEKAQDLMTRVSGSKKEGQYTASTRRFTYTGTFSFYIEVTDSKGQKTKTDEQKFTLK